MENMHRYPKPARLIILEFLKKANKPVRTMEIVKETGIAYNTVRGRLYELKRDGIIEYTPEGWVCLKKDLT